MLSKEITNSFHFNACFLFFHCPLSLFQEESFKWSHYGQILLQNNEFLWAEQCAHFALYFQASASVRAQGHACRAFARYGLGRRNDARNDINEVKRLDRDLAKVRKNSSRFLKYAGKKLAFSWLEYSLIIFSFTFCEPDLMKKERIFQLWAIIFLANKASVIFI